MSEKLTAVLTFNRECSSLEEVSKAFEDAKEAGWDIANFQINKPSKMLGVNSVVSRNIGKTRNPDKVREGQLRKITAVSRKGVTYTRYVPADYLTREERKAKKDGQVVLSKCACPRCDYKPGKKEILGHCVKCDTDLCRVGEKCLPKTGDTCNDCLADN